jgi:hypothetical protein
MGKVQIILSTMIAVLTISFIVTSVASAGPEFLINGLPITSKKENQITSGSLLLEETSLKVDITCEVSGTGTVGPGAADTTSTLTISKCESKSGCEPTITVTAVNLPWKTELLDVGASEIRDMITSGGSGSPGWLIECRVLGVKVSDTCTAAEASSKATNLENNVDMTFDETSESSTCTIGGAKTGLNLGLILESIIGVKLEVNF